MPTDLGQQLLRFAEALDREAPAISVDEILSRGPVAVDVDRLDGSLSDRPRRVNGMARGNATSKDRDGERHTSIELAPTAAEPPTRRRVALKIVLAAAAAAVLVVALASIVRIGDESDPADLPPSTVPAPPTTTVEQPTSAYTSSDGEVTVSAPSTWETWLPGTFETDSWDVWLGRLWRSEDLSASGDRIEFVDPVAYDSWCADNGGSPLLTAPVNAAAIAQQLIADPNFETTVPVAARIGGVEALLIDVTLAPGGKACGIGMIDIPRWIHTIGWDPELRLRLYLVDLPEGMSVETLAITVVAPEERFDDVIAETAPIIESIEFHPG